MSLVKRITETVLAIVMSFGLMSIHVWATGIETVVEYIAEEHEQDDNFEMYARTDIEENESLSEEDDISSKAYTEELEETLIDHLESDNLTEEQKSDGELIPV